MAERYVMSRIRDDRVTVFIKRGCPYSRNAMEMLKGYNFIPGSLQEFDITGLDDVQDYFQRTTGQRTVPRVFIGRRCIGGFSDLERLRQNLPTMLRQIGALK
ncbi:PREDICTED: glutaredoxin-1 [Calidris pugnax]|uniref:glutaredoxin-1 n=1 Tax=Calidris pugnax TaxID=198806 RepID=UPI00071C4854|nr:PREDICTED: glutaredoxin-1 [Calidris pugnax]